MLTSRLNQNSIPGLSKTTNFKAFMIAAWAKFSLVSLAVGFSLFLAVPASAGVKDLKLTNKVVDKTTKSITGNFKYKNTNVTVVSYLPKGKTKPITALVFDTFSLDNYVTDEVEKAVLRDFQFGGAALIAVPEGSEVLNVKASDLPAPMVAALGGANTGIFPLNLKTGVNFAAKAGMKSGSLSLNLMNAMGIKKTSHVVKGTLSAKFFDLTCILSPRDPLCKLFSWKDLLALLKFDINFPTFKKPTFWVPFEFDNTKFTIARERNLLGEATGVIQAAFVSDITINTPGIGKSTYPAVRISGSLDTGITFASWRGINWPKIPQMPWVSITDVKLASTVKRDPLKLNAPPILEVKMTAKGRVNEIKDIPIESSFEIQGVKLTGFYWYFPKFSLDLSKIPGLKDIPGLSGVRLTDPIISLKTIGGKLSVDKLGIDKAPVLFFKTNKPKGWSFATLRDNFSAATLISQLKGTPIEKIKFKKAALIISKPGFKGKVIDLPKKARAFLKGPLPDDDMPLPLASGINIAGTFAPNEAGDVGKVLKSLGTPDQLVLFGGVTGVFDKKKPSFRMSGNFLKLSMPDLGFFKIPQPKNAPAVFMEYINDQPAIGVEIEETLPIKDGNNTINFNSKLAFTVGPGGASIAMTGTSEDDWANPFKIKGLTLKKGTSLSVAGGVTGPQVSFKGITQIGSKVITLGGTVSGVGPVITGAAIRGSIDSLGLSDIAALAAEMAKAGGKKLDVSGLPVAEFKKVDIAFASPGISIPELGISNGGTRMRGDFYFLDTKKSLGRLDVNLDTTGMAVKADLADIILGPLKLEKNKLDISAKASATTPPGFSLTSQTKFLGLGTKIDVNATAQNIDVASTQQFGDVFKFGLNVSTGGSIDWGKADFSKSDLRLNASLKADPGKWIRDNAQKVVKDAFSTLTSGFGKASKDLKAAQDKVDGLNKEIKKQRAIVDKEKEPGINRLKKAEADIKKLNGTIGSLNGQISTFKGRIKRCRQNKRICVWGKPKRNGCGKRVFGKCIWYKYKWRCQKHRNIPNYPARAYCEARNTVPRAELVVAEGKKVGVVAAKVAAGKTVEALRKGLEAIPTDLDPRVAALIAAKVIATAVLDAAKETVKGLGDFTKVLAAGTAAVTQGNFFVLDKSSIRGSLREGLKGKPVLLDMNFKLSGKPFKNRFGFSLTDWKYNAKQFEVIALGAATKAVVAAGKKYKIVPHVLLDRVNKLFFDKQAKVDEDAQKAMEANGQIQTAEGDAKLSMGKSIDLDNRIRRVRQEAARKKKIAFRKFMRGFVDKKRAAQLAKLLVGGKNKWKKMSGAAIDIGAGSNGSVWVVGTNQSPYSWDGKNWKKMPGGITRIDMGPKGDAWALNKNHDIYTWNGKTWKKIQGKAWDIGVGANGKVWHIGGGDSIYRRDGNKWTKIPGGAVRIDVDPNGNAWVVNKNNQIYRYDGKKWIRTTGKALDIAVSSNGTVMVIGTDRAPWVWDGKTWHKLPGANLKNLTLDKDGNPMGTTTNNQIWAWGAAIKPPPAKTVVISKKKFQAQVKKMQQRHRAQQRKIQQKMKKKFGFGR